MENRIPGANRCFLATHRLPSQSDARLDSGLVQLNTDPPVSMNARRCGTEAQTRVRTGNQVLAGLKIEIRLAVVGLSDRRDKCPSYSQVQSQVRSHPPIILDERPEQFPSATGGCAIERLIVNRTTYLAEKQVCRRVASKSAKINKDTILEGVRLHVHLLSADAATHPDVVLAPNHIERVGNGEDVGPALEGSKSAITQRPVSAHKGRTQSATDAVLC